MKPETRSSLILQAALRLLGPLVKFLLRNGVDYPRFANALKSRFLSEAELLLKEDQLKGTDSALSTLSGVHRKDVRAWREAGATLPQARHLTPVMELFTSWASDPAYCDKRGRPRILHRAGPEGSFEALAQSISSDVHPRTLLNELLRLGVVELLPDKDGDDRLRLCADSFVPKADMADMLALFADNVGDHMAAAVRNLSGQGEPLLEQSIYADELQPESVDALNQLGRNLWAGVFREMAKEAARLVKRDKGRPEANRRVRLGMYFFQDWDGTNDRHT